MDLVPGLQFFTGMGGIKNKLHDNAFLCVAIRADPVIRLPGLFGFDSTKKRMRHSRGVPVES